MFGDVPLTEARRKELSEQAKRNWEDPVIREKMLNRRYPGNRTRRTEEEKRRAGELSRERWQDPEYRKRLSKSRTGKKMPPFTEEHRKHLSEAHKGKNAGKNHPQYGQPKSDITRQKISERAKERWQDPERRKRLEEAARDPERIRKQSITKIGPSNPQYGNHPSFETREKMSAARSGAKNPQWRGGIAERKYCEKWTEARRESVREKFFRKCPICDTPENGKKLHVHHIDYNKMQGCGARSWNLMPMCHHHHATSGSHRYYWFALLYNHWVMNPDINLNIPGDQSMKIEMRYDSWAKQ